MSMMPTIFTKIIISKTKPIVNTFLIDEQHGFRENQSTITNLNRFKQNIFD